jgi:hypothetical protein
VAAPVLQAVPEVLSLEPEVVARAAGRAVEREVDRSPEREEPLSVEEAAAPVARQQARAAREWAVAGRAVEEAVQAEAADAVAAPAARAVAFPPVSGGRRPGWS